ncbi:dihydrofolate reductase [Patescibacteria group bacterium]|nr:dihydrofolate reductase [Patescibacteria group bacterium]
MNAKISLIVAVDNKNGMGKVGKMPWHVPADLKRFKELTTGKIIIMGRKTFDSIGRILPNRTNIIITRDKDYKVGGAVVVNSLEEAIKLSKQKLTSQKNLDSGIFIIGGGEIFRQSMKIADRIYLTKIKGDFNADTFFPDYSDFKKNLFEELGEDNGYKYKFLELEK